MRIYRGFGEYNNLDEKRNDDIFANILNQIPHRLLKSRKRCVKKHRKIKNEWSVNIWMTLIIRKQATGLYHENPPNRKNDRKKYK